MTEALDEDKGIISSINAPFNSITTTAFPPSHLIIIIVVIKSFCFFTLNFQRDYLGTAV